MENEFDLRGLSVLSELNGRDFKKLSARDQRRIENRTIRCIVITEESHPDIKFDVFERLNTGSVKLSAQELRNAIYRGVFNDELRSLADDPRFRSLLARDKDARMGDEELILRFLALVDQLDGYKPPLRQFLNEYMREHQTESIDPHLVDLFRKTCETVSAVLGANAFRMPGALGPLNKAVFDSVMIAVARSDQSQVITEADEVRRIHEELLDDPDFEPLVGRATADRARMLRRIAMFLMRLSDIGIDVNQVQLEGE